MGFGIKLDVKVEAPKVALPKVDVAAAVSGVTGAVTGAAESAKAAITGAVGAVTGVVTGAVSAAAGVASSLSSVAGAVLDVEVSFTGATEDFVLEPHAVLDANGDYQETQFDKGPICILVDLTPEEARRSTDGLHVFSKSGNYDEVRSIAEDYVQDDRSQIEGRQESIMVMVKFEEAPMSESYSLEIVPTSGAPYCVFQGVTYGDLRREAVPLEETSGKPASS